METQIKLENISSIQKKFLVTISAQRVSKIVEKKFIEAQKVAKMKGFRPGKIPLNMVKQYYAEDVKEKALRALISETYSEALKLHPLRIVGEPQIEGVPHGHEAMVGHQHQHVHLHEGEALSYAAIVEVIPEVEPKDYKGLSLEKKTAVVTPEDLEKIKKNIMDRKVEVTPVERRAQTGDLVEFKYEGKLKTDQGYETQANLSGDRSAEVGSSQLLPEFEKNIIGLKAGESKTFKINYPTDFTEANLAGKEAEYTLDLREVKEMRYPDFNDELVKEFGYESLADFEKKSSETILKNKTAEADEQFRNQMIEKLIDKNKFEVPQALVYSQIRALASDYSQELKRYGFNEQMIQSALTSQLEEFKKRAEMQVRAGILLDSIAKKEKIEPTAADYETEMKKMAKDFNMELKDLKKRMENTPRDMENFQYRVREELTIRQILSTAKIA